MGRVIEITREIFQVGGSDVSNDLDASAFLIRGPECAVLIDAGAGSGSETIWHHILEQGVKPEQLSHLILTHGHVDHIGGAAYFKEKTNCLIVAHSLDREAIETGNPSRTGASWYGITLPTMKVDRVLTREAEEIPIGGGVNITCLHTPGHTPGSISPYLDRDGKRILFGQDIHGPFLKEFGANMKDWRDSMQKLIALEADILCEGHFGIYYSRPEVRTYIERFLRQYSKYRKS